MKVYPLLFSRSFPHRHPRYGQPTLFVENIQGGGKITTVRDDYEHWHRIISEVQAGTAVLSLRYWVDFRQSRCKEFARLTAADGVGIERLVDYAGHGQVSAHEDPNYRRFVYLDDLADNDGLNEDDFRSWFRGWGLEKERAIIHLSPLRYMESDAKVEADGVAV